MIASGASGILTERCEREAKGYGQLRYALYPGCAAKGATPELYQSTMAIIGRLDIQIVELAAASCCGAGVVTEADPDIALALNARTFAQAEQLGLDIMTICGTCQGIMSAANKRLKTEPGLLKRINEVLAQDGLSLWRHDSGEASSLDRGERGGPYRPCRPRFVSRSTIFALPHSMGAISSVHPGIWASMTRKTLPLLRRSFEPWEASR